MAKALTLTLEYETPTWYTMDVVRDATRALPTGTRITGVSQVNPNTWSISYVDNAATESAAVTREVQSK